MDNQYNPRNVRDFFGKTFVTLDSKKGEYHRHGLSAEGKATGSIGIVGEEVELIAGVKPQYYNFINDYMTSATCTKKGLDARVLGVGQMPEKGLHLVMVLKDPIKSEEFHTETYGMISSPIEKIE